MSQLASDITNTLDKMWANENVTKFFPGLTACWKKLKNAPAKLINSVGGHYLSQSEIPWNQVAQTFANSESGTFGDAGKIKFLVMSVTAITHRAAVKWSGHIDVQNRPAQKEAPAKKFDYVMELIKGQIRAQGLRCSRELWGDQTAEIGRVSAFSTPTVTCANSGNLFGTYNIHQGMDVMFWDGSAYRTANDGYGKVATVDKDARTFTMNSGSVDGVTYTLPTGITNNDKIFPSLGTTSGKDAGLAGIDYLMGASGGFQGLSAREDNYRTKGIQIAMSGANISASALRKMTSKQYFRLDGEESGGVFYASAQRDGYEQTGIALQGYGQSGDTMKRGYRKLFFDEKPFEKDPFVPRDAVALVDMDLIDLFEMEKFHPLKDESGYILPVPDTATYKDQSMIRFRGHMNLGTAEPARLGVWADGFSTSGLELGYT